MPRPKPVAFPPAPIHLDDDDDPFAAHARRDPLPKAEVRVIVVAASGPHAPDDIADGLVATLGRLGRRAEAVVVLAEDRGWDRAIERGLVGATQPLVLVASSSEPWTEAHLRPLLDSINTCDHVLGRRPLGMVGRLGRWLASRPWRWLFAIPALDVHSPCRLHRREKLEAIPLQSASRFLDVELLAKATFFGHLIDEVPVPAMADAGAAGTWGDFVEVFRHPVLKPEEGSGPAEDPQGEQERPDGPGRQDQEGPGHVEQAGPF